MLDTDFILPNQPIPLLSYEKIVKALTGAISHDMTVIISREKGEYYS